jgi:Kef-type K+ transport system membrane component KefB/nucleotide-binding universal stress UspA family protein
MLGAMFLLMLTGIETDTQLIRRNARIATGVALGGLVVPFGLGYLTAYAIPDDLLANPERPVVFALFFATGLAVSAIPVIAKVLLDLGLLRRRFGQTVLAAGMIDDTAAWILLSIVIALATEAATTPTTMAVAAGRIVVFLALSVTVGRWIVDRALAFAQDRGTTPDGVLTLAVATAFGFGALALGFGIEAVMGAFVAGVVLGLNPRLPVEVVGRLHSMALAVFAPVFFAMAGLAVDVSLLAEPRPAALTALVVTVAVVGKCGGAAVMARWMGVDGWTSLAYGAALNARGAVGIIIASIGLDIGILSPTVYSMIVVTSVVTSMIAPPLVRAFLRRGPTDPEEDHRLERESTGPIAGITPRRVLVPMRARPEVAPVHEIISDLVASISDTAAVTILTVTDRTSRPEADLFLERVATRFPPRTTRRAVVADDVIGTIVRLAGTGYDLVVLGAPEVDAGQDLFDPVIDAVTCLAPCPTLIVAGRRLDRVVWPPARILVPADGTNASRGAARLALTIARGAVVSAVHVVPRSPYARTGAPQRAVERRTSLGREFVDDVARLGPAYSTPVEGHVIMGRGDLSSDILSAVADQRADLVVMSTNVRPGSTRLHLGPQVEAILKHAPCPVLLLNES